MTKVRMDEKTNSRSCLQKYSTEHVLTQQGNLNAGQGHREHPWYYAATADKSFRRGFLIFFLIGMRWCRWQEIHLMALYFCWGRLKLGLKEEKKGILADTMQSLPYSWSKERKNNMKLERSEATACIVASSGIFSKIAQQEG